MGLQDENRESFDDALAKANEAERKKKQTAVASDIDINDADALRKLAKGALVEIVQTAPRNISLVGAIRELLDRIDGKAPQSVSMTVKQSPESTLSSDQLAALLAMLPNSPMIIPPMPGKLED